MKKGLIDTFDQFTRNVSISLPALERFVIDFAGLVPC